MNLVETIVGNVNDASWKKQLDGATLDYLNLDQWQAKTGSVLMAKATSNCYLADRNCHLPMATFSCGTPRRERRRPSNFKVLVIQYSRVARGQRKRLRMLRVGHALGNQHWPRSKGRKYTCRSPWIAR